MAHEPVYADEPEEGLSVKTISVRQSRLNPCSNMESVGSWMHYPLPNGPLAYTHETLLQIPTGIALD